MPHPSPSCRNSNTILSPIKSSGSNFLLLLTSLRVRNPIDRLQLIYSEFMNEPQWVFNRWKEFSSFCAGLATINYNYKITLLLPMWMHYEYEVSLNANKNLYVCALCECVCSFIVKSFQTPSFQPSTASNRYIVVALLLNHYYLWRACACVCAICDVRRI